MTGPYWYEDKHGNMRPSAYSRDRHDELCAGDCRALTKQGSD